LCLKWDNFCSLDVPCIFTVISLGFLGAFYSDAIAVELYGAVPWLSLDNRKGKQVKKGKLY
jgi:hypothetical protein